jgi:hypothetical protein
MQKESAVQVVVVSGVFTDGLANAPHPPTSLKPALDVLLPKSIDVQVAKVTGAVDERLSAPVGALPASSGPSAFPVWIGAFTP